MRLPITQCLLAVALAVVSLAGCDQVNSSGSEDEGGAVAPAGPKTIPTAMVESKSFVQRVELPGASVRGFETTRLMAQVGGYVKEIKTVGGEEIDVGTFVEKDTELAVIDVPERQDQLTEKTAMVAQANSVVSQADAVIKQREAGVDQRAAEEKQAMAELDEKQALLKLALAKQKRIEDLVKKQTIGAENLDEARFEVDAANAAIAAVNAGIETAKANVKAANADLEKAKADKDIATEEVKVAEAKVSELKTRIGYATIKAPFTGVITKRMVDHGAFVRPATSNSGAMPLFEITRTDKVRVVVSVPNIQAGNVRAGQKAEVHSIGGLGNDRISGTITRVAGALDAESRMMRVEMHFSNPLQQPNSDRKISLVPGMFGTVSVVVKEWKDLAVVPTTAIGSDENGKFVVVVTDGKATRQSVTVAYDDAKSVGISSGVKPGKTIVTQDAGTIEDGQTIPLN